FLGDPRGENGLLFYFRPENRDVMWYQVRDSQWYGPVATAPYRSFSKDLQSSIQDVARLVFGGLPAAIGLVGVFALLGAIGRGRSQPRRSADEVDRRPTIARRGMNVPSIPDLASGAIAIAGLAAALYVATALLE